MKLSACIEWLFADEAENVGDRIRLAHQNGVESIEFWKWTNKDLNEIESALRETGTELTSFVAEPMIPLTDPANRDEFLRGLEASIKTAQRLGARTLIAQAGNDLPDIPAEAQRDALRETLARAAEVLKGSGVRLGVEPLNTLIDHIGYFLPSTSEALAIVNDTGKDEIGIVYDLYHSAVMGEHTSDVIGNNMHKVFHIHIADHPGRSQPGSGTVDLRERLEWLVTHGYKGAVGLEYRPIEPSSKTIETVRKLTKGLQ